MDTWVVLSLLSCCTAAVSPLKVARCFAAACCRVRWKEHDVYNQIHKSAGAEGGSMVQTGAAVAKEAARGLAGARSESGVMG